MYLTVTYTFLNYSEIFKIPHSILFSVYATKPRLFILTKWKDHFENFEEP